MDFIDELSNEYRLEVGHAIKLRAAVVKEMRFRYKMFWLIIIVVDALLLWIVL